MCLLLNISNAEFFHLTGRDAAFIGPNENQFAILDDDKTSLALYILPGTTLLDAGGKKKEAIDKENGAVEQSESADTNAGSIKGPLQFLFETEIDRIFSTPIGTEKLQFHYFTSLIGYSRTINILLLLIESTLLFATHGSQIGLAKLVQGYRLSTTNGHYISTKSEGKKSIKLKINETVLQVIS